MKWFDECALCGMSRAPGLAGAEPSPCSRCHVTLRWAPPDAAPPAGLDACRSLLLYDDVARRLVTRLKYRNDRRLLGWLVDGMAGLLVPPAGVLVTWLPTTGSRRRRRGFDQAALLAHALARRWRARCHGVLVRGEGPAQTGRSRVERTERVPLVANRSVSGPVVLVDDVVTTGTTLRCGASALRAAGASWVGGLTAARTPRPGAVP